MRLAGAQVALVLVERVSEPSLFDVVAADDEVEQEPSTGDPLIGRGHLCAEQRRHQTRAKRDQKLEALGDLRETRGHHPSLLAPTARRRQRGFESQLLGRPCDLTDVADARGALDAAVRYP